MWKIVIKTVMVILMFQVVGGENNTVETMQNGNFRNLNGNSSNLNGNLSNLNRDSSNFNGNLSNLSVNSSDLNGNSSDLNGNSSSLNGNLSNLNRDSSNLNGNFSNLSGNSSDLNGNSSNLKYILVWTIDPTLWVPFDTSVDLKTLPFIEQNCKYQNCYFTSNRTLLQSVSFFDAILFHGKVIDNFTYPSKRAKSGQYYIFVMDECMKYYSKRKCYFNNYFNLTMTYRLDSDIPYPYFKIIDKTDNNSIVGPSFNMEWKKNVKHKNEEFLSILAEKTKLAAWFVSNCRPLNGRMDFGHSLKIYLSRANLSVDIFGDCGNVSCPSPSICDQMLSKDYMFYLAFENSNDKDYVTEKVLRAMRNNVVPVVYGGANYSRFLPPGSYLDAKKLGPRNLANIMIYVHRHRSIYPKFFEWKSTYEFVENTMGFSCDLCAVLNAKKRRTFTHPRFVDWWYGPKVIEPETPEEALC